MTVSELMEAMAEAGAPMAAIIMAVRALEEKDAVIEARRAGDRDRKRRQRGSVTGQSRDTDGTVTGEPPFLDKEIPPKPPKEINPIPVRETRTRGISLPVGWKPEKLSRDTVSGQIIEQRGQDWARRALETFDNHWRAKTGKDAAKGDWQKTWANWVIEQDRRDGRNGRQQQQPANDGLGSTVRAGLDALRILEQRAGH